MKPPLFERESGQAISFRAGGVEHELAPPASLSFDDLLTALSAPEHFVAIVFPPDAPRVSLTAIETLLDAWVESYGLVGGRSLTRLLFLVDRYASELEWDFAQHLAGISPADLWLERRWRKLLSLIDMLPQATRYHQAVLSDPEHVERLVEAYSAAGQDSENTRKPKPPPLSTWTPEVEKLQGVIDAVERATWAIVASNSDGKPPKQPEPGLRPDAEIVGKIKYMQWKMAHARHKKRAARMVPHRYPNGVDED